MAYGLRLQALITALLLTPGVSLSAQQLAIRFFDVGQGDAALIVSPEGKTALIDAGPDDWKVLAELRRLHVDTLDLVVASHKHADHISGLLAVVESLVVRNYMENTIRTTTATYRDLDEAVTAKGIRRLEASARTLQLGAVSLRILPTAPDAVTQNNSSVGVLLTYGTFTALFTGDAETPARDYWREHANLPSLVLLKVAHHGALNGTDSAWQAVTSPCYAVIAVGFNDYGHPAPETIQTLVEGGTVVYRTDRDGTVEVDVARQGNISFHIAKPAGDSTAIARAGPIPAGCPAGTH